MSDRDAWWRMMAGHDDSPPLYYDTQARPIPLLVWAPRWWQVGHTTLGDVDISTVWLGLDHGFGSPEPLIFETMIFAGDSEALDGWQDRYATWEEAALGHQAAVQLVQLEQAVR